MRTEQTGRQGSRNWRRGGELAGVARGWRSAGHLCGQESSFGRAPAAVGREGEHPCLPGLVHPVCRLAADGSCAYRASELIQRRKEEVMGSPTALSTHPFVHPTLIYCH